MNYLKPELIDGLASEYVVGTLRGRARKRFERLMVEHYWIRAAVWQWEAQVTPMINALTPVEPPKRVWRSISSELHSGGRSRRTLIWPVWAVAASLFAAAMTALLVARPVTPGAELVAVFNDDNASPLWAISADLDTGEISARAINAKAAAVDKVFQLWMLPEDGSPPRSLGLLPVSGGSATADLPAGLNALLRSNAGLAISIEPVGGSPTGLPTGPVVHQAQWVSLSL